MNKLNLEECQSITIGCIHEHLLTWTISQWHRQSAVDRNATKRKEKRQTERERPMEKEQYVSIMTCLVLMIMMMIMKCVCTFPRVSLLYNTYLCYLMSKTSRYVLIDSSRNTSKTEKQDAFSTYAQQK
jgi:membrane protein YqaA with SNARE-associated domain